MKRKMARSILPAAILFTLVYGIARSATSRYDERRRAILAAAVAERTKLGLTDRKALFAKYPSPEITLCRAVQVPPGASAEVVIRGKFAAGTKFLFETDVLEVVRENITPTEYRATVAAPREAGPSNANAYAYAAVSAGYAQCLAARVGGRYEWDFTADNGWRVRLSPVREKAGSDANDPPEQIYRAELFRGAEAKAFASFEAELDLAGAHLEPSYSAHLTAETPMSPVQAELEKLQERMTNMSKLSPAEQQKLMQRMEQLAEKMMADMNRQLAQQQESQRKMEELGCTAINFRLAAGAATGRLACGSSPANLKGTMKFLGPWGQ